MAWTYPNADCEDFGVQYGEATVAGQVNAHRGSIPCGESNIMSVFSCTAVSCSSALRQQLCLRILKKLQPAVRSEFGVIVAHRAHTSFDVHTVSALVQEGRCYYMGSLGRPA